MPKRKKKLREWGSAEVAKGRKSAKAWQRFFEKERDEVEKAEEIEQAARIGEAIDRHEEELLGLPGVAGVGVGLKQKDGKPNGEVALTVFVEKKERNVKKLGDKAVPKELGKVETDIVEVGRLEPLSFHRRVRPAMPGYSIGHANVTAGTFGCLVRDLKSPTQQHLLLGNNHVLADTNRGRLGDPILQPGPYDGGGDQDTVAILERFEPIHFGLEEGSYNLVDAAVARPVSQRQVTASVIGSLIPQSVGQAFLGDRVMKAGRTTGVTQGRVVSVNATVIVWFPSEDGESLRPAVFRHQILTTFMSTGGDSGSLLMDRHLSAVGLVFAGSPLLTVASHIADVESALGVRTLTAPRPNSELKEIRRHLRKSQPTEDPEPNPPEPPEEDDSDSQPSPPPDDSDGGPQPSPPPDDSDGGPQPAPPPDDSDAGPQPAPPPDDSDAGPQPVPPPDDSDAGPQSLAAPSDGRAAERSDD